MFGCSKGISLSGKNGEIHQFGCMWFVVCRCSVNGILFFKLNVEMLAGGLNVEP